MPLHLPALTCCPFCFESQLVNDLISREFMATLLAHLR